MTRVAAAGAGGGPLRVGRADQLVFDGIRRLEALRAAAGPVGRLAAAAGLRVLGRAGRMRARRGALVRATVWGQSLVLRADQRLPAILADCPRFGEPLALLVQAVGRTPVRVIDVGANVGDTVALLEAAAPGRCEFLCIEPHPGFAALCRANTAGNPRVRVVECFLADRAGLPVRLHAHAPGKAASRLVADGGAEPAGAAAPARTRTLDATARDFVAGQGGVDVLKVDTDGFDFKVLRSAPEILARSRPVLFFELHPALWREADEDPAAVFPFLEAAGYRHFVFFTNRGQVHARLDAPAPAAVQTLVDLCLARRRLDDFHFDVLAGDAETCGRVVGASLARLAGAGR